MVVVEFPITQEEFAKVKKWDVSQKCKKNGTSIPFWIVLRLILLAWLTEVLTDRQPDRQTGGASESWLLLFPARAGSGRGTSWRESEFWTKTCVLSASHNGLRVRVSPSLRGKGTERERGWEEWGSGRGAWGWSPWFAMAQLAALSQGI